MGLNLVSTGVNETLRCKPGMTATSLKSGQKLNANDTAGKAIGFGNVMFGQSEAPVVPLFPVRPVAEAVALAA